MKFESFMENQIRFDLICNAIDSIEHTVELIAYDQDVDRAVSSKRAMISIAHGIELLLKERLRQIHPSLIWENVDRYPDLDSRTVSTEKALVRLEKIGGLVFGERDQRLLRSLRKIRNAIEHYKWSISEDEAEYLLGASLSFAIGFLKEHLGKDILGYADREGGVLQDLLSRSESFAASYEARLKNEASNEPLKCGFCKTLLKEEDGGACPKCGHWNYSIFRRKDFDFDDLDDIPF